MQKGQALLMMLLILGVAITVGLSVASRSVTDVNLTGTEDQSAKALQAAEAGVEKALGGVYPVKSQSGPISLGGAGSAKFNVKTDELKTTSGGPAGKDYYKVPYDLNAGDVTTINLNGYLSNPNLGICWGAKDKGENTSVEVILYYTSGGSTHVTRAGYSPTDPVLSGFTKASGSESKCSDFAYSQKVNLTDLEDKKGYMYMRIRVIANSSLQPVAVVPYGGDFPSQGKDITSTGQYGDTAQKVHVLQPAADLPFMFDSALFSGDTLSQ